MESRRVRRLGAAVLAIAVITGPAKAGHYRSDPGPAKAGHYRDHRVDAVSRVVSGFSRTRTTTVPLTAEMVIDRSLVVQPRTYRLPASADLKTAAITIRGENITMFVDGEAVLDEWEPHESQVSRVKLPGGTHRIKIEYYEAEGFAQMRFDIQRK